MEYNFNSEKLREKRKALRIKGKNGKSKMVSQSDFIDLLKEKGCSIGRSSLSKLENGKIPDDLSLKDILVFCDVLGCDIYYLLDISKNSTKELETICNYTGLSEKAANKLHELNNHEGLNQFPQMISNLLSNYYDHFSELIIEIFLYLINVTEENSFTKIDSSEDWSIYKSRYKRIEDAHNSSSIALMNCLQEIQRMEEQAKEDKMIQEQISLRKSHKTK